LINLWKALNYQIVHIVENIPDEALQRTCDTPKQNLKGLHWSLSSMIM
jgi:hypothetical protein